VAQKLSDSAVQQILRLHNEQIEIAEIARRLNLKKMQVSAIIAHSRLAANPHEAEPGGSVVTEEALDPELSPSALVEEYSSPAETPEPPVVEEQQEKEEGIFVGDDTDYPGSLYWNPQDAGTVQNPHLMVIGESGSGKTYALQCLTAELAQREIPSIIFDYGQGFELETLDPVYQKYVAVNEYRVGEDGIALNPLQIFPKDIKGPASVAARLSDVFDAVYHVGHVQRKVLIEAILATFEKKGILTDTQSTWKKDPPIFADLQQTLDDLASDKQYPNRTNAVGLAARLMTFFMLSSFTAGKSVWSWETLIADSKHRVHILQFRGLEGKTQKVIVEILLWHLFFYLKSHGQGRLRLYCILDEAHHLSFREGGPLDLLLREARKFGLGLIFASQQPEDFSEVAFSNTASKLVFQIADPNLKVSRYLAVKCDNYESPEQIHDVVAVLKQGDAFFLSRNRGYKVHIADLRSRAAQWREV
jgi:DNA phosphorothioation-dependent restriction protein DptH